MLITYADWGYLTGGKWCCKYVIKRYTYKTVLLNWICETLILSTKCHYKTDFSEKVSLYRPVHRILVLIVSVIYTYSKTCLKRPLSKRQKISFQDQLSLNGGQKYCRMGAFCNTFDLH